MISERSGDYRAFASAAKEAGFDKDERKLVALDSELLFEGTSEYLRSHLNAEMLQSFFRSLQEDETVDSKKVLGIGNFLYDYRLHKEESEEVAHESLNEKDRRLVNLGCVLIENAFYGGKLNSLDDERAAALAFTTNIIAKILEQSPDDDSSVGFSQEKMTRFIDEVHSFEQKSLFGDSAIRKQSIEKNSEIQTAREEMFQEKQAEIMELLKQAEGLKPEKGWLDYFKDVPERLEQAKQVLSDGKILLYQEDHLIDSVAEGFKTKMPKIVQYFEKKIAELSSMVTAGIETVEGVDIYNSELSFRRSLSDVMLLDFPDINFARGSSGNRDQRRKSIASLKTLENIQKRAKEKIVPSDTSGKKKFQGWDQITRGLNTMLLPEAIKTLDTVLSIKPNESWGEYLAKYYRVAGVVESAKLYQDLDVKFIHAEEQLLPKLNKEKSAIPYLIKSNLIANSMLRRNKDITSVFQISRVRHFDDRGRGATLPVHAFLPKDGYEYALDENHDLRQNLGPAYSNLHFIPQELPFSLWSIMYLRSKAEKK